MSKVARLPLALIITATMLMTLASTVAAAPSAGGPASTTALTEHDEGACDVVLEGATAAELEQSLMAALEAVEGEVVLDATQLEALAAELALVAASGGTACVDLETLTVFTHFCAPDLAALIGLLEGEVIDTEALVAAVETIIPGEDVALNDVLGEVVDLTTLTRQQLLDLAEAFGITVVEECVENAFDIGDIVQVVDPQTVCVRIIEGGFEFVLGDPALIDPALIAELEALLATLPVEVGDVVCVVLVPGVGLGPVVVIVEGDINIGIVDFGDITIGDCSNAVITVIVNGENVEANVVQNVEGQCVAVVPAPDDDGAAPDDDDDGAAPDDDTPGMLPDTSVTDAPVYGALILALVALVSVGTLGYANISARRNR